MSKVDWSKAPEGAEFYANLQFRKLGKEVYSNPLYFNDELNRWCPDCTSIDTLKLFTDYEKRPEQQAVANERQKGGFIDEDALANAVRADYLRGSDSTILPTLLLNNHEDESKPKKDGNKYHREIIGFCGTMVEVDVYRVLDAFKTESPAIDHAVKKMLCTGIRGHKDYLTDIDNAIESLQEARLLHLQKQEINKA